jgi:hypothetical protein
VTKLIDKLAGDVQRPVFHPDESGVRHPREEAENEEYLFKGLPAEIPSSEFKCSRKPFELAVLEVPVYLVKCCYGVLK